MKKIVWTELLIFVVSAELVGALSALLSGSFTDVYLSLVRPPLSPPAWLFPLVWSVLYALMGISAYLVWNKADFSAKKAYIAQLSVNFIWSIVFFRFRSLSIAAILAVVLFVLVLNMTAKFGKIKVSAAYLQFPYVFWSAFASYLAVGTWLLNRSMS